MQIKKYIALAISLPSLILASCSDPFAGEEGAAGPVTVGLWAGSGGATRTHIDADGLGTSWTEDDRIALWAENASPEFTLAAQPFDIFFKRADASEAYFTATLQQAMPEGSYTYYATCPLPAGIDGTRASFVLPDVQDGRVGGGADIMVAVPAEAPQLTRESELSLELRHKLHVLKFYIPEGANALGEPVRRIVFTMPQQTAGTVTTDITDPDADAVLADGTNTVTIRLDEPIDASAADARAYACASIFPSEPYADGAMQVSLYSDNYAATVDDIRLAGRTFAAGHATPVPLHPVLKEFQNKIRFTIAANNLGEDVHTITLTAPEGVKWREDGDNVFTIDASNIYADGYYDLNFDTYASAALYEALAGLTISVQFESENAVVASTFTMPDTKADTSADIALEVPYLLYEDFDNAAEYSNSGDDASEQTDADAAMIPDETGLLHKGWSGAQIRIEQGRLRLRNRREYAISIFGIADSYGNYRGRVDSAPLSGIKSGRTVKVKVEFSYGGGTENSVFTPLMNCGYTTDPSALKGYYEVYVGNKLSASGGNTIEFPVMESETPDIKSTWTSELKSAQYEIDACGPETRLSWDVNATGAKSSTYCNQWLYIDDIKVQIVK